jgi:hypothetical protein
MAKQINQYTKIRTESSVTLSDLLDFDSTDDSGVSYESAKITVEEFRKYLAAAIPTLYSDDGQIDAVRNVGMQGFAIEFENGTLINKADLNDVGYLLQDSLGVEKGSLGYDVGLDSATLDLKDANGTFLSASDGDARITSSSGTLLDADYTKDALGFGIPAQNGTKFLFFNSAARTNVFNFVNSTNSTNFAFTDAGNFGMGTATPTNTLTVTDALGGQVTGLKVTGTSFGDVLGLAGSSGSWISRRGVQVTGASGANMSSPYHVAVGMSLDANNGTTPVLSVNNSTGNVAIAVENGRVGIGTAAPLVSMDIVGECNASIGYKVGGVTGFTGTGAYTTLTIVGGIITNAL